MENKPAKDKMGYEPLDLSSYLNCSLEIYPRAISPGVKKYQKKIKPPVGKQFFHGLPFQIGNGQGEAGNHFIGFGKKDGLKQDSVSITVGKKARHVLFAHALLETGLWEGEPIGKEIARYAVHLKSGDTIEIPIRERFEIDNIPFAFGQKPFLCISDTKPQLYHRYQGQWEEIGERQTEVSWGQPRGYYLFVWTNPRPESAIRAIEIQPGERVFVLAAITLGHLEEFPVVRSTRQPVKIILKKAEDISPPFLLEVAVDRGVVTLPHPLPENPLTSQDERIGFGAPFNEGNSPAYAEIAALPSATITLMKDGEELAAVNWGNLKKHRTVNHDRVRLEVLGNAKNWVQVAVLDYETGQHLPCRIAFHSPEGVPYSPHGHHASLFSNLDTWHIDVGGDVRLGQISYAYIDGRCQGWLPRGEVLVDLACGFEYIPQRTRITIDPNQRHLELRLKRFEKMNQSRWFSGDSHVHFLSAVGSLLEAQGEGLNVVNLLQSQWGHLFTNTEEFVGRPHISPDGKTVVYVSQENRQHMLGHLSLLGLKSPVMPWCSGGPSEAELGGGLDATLSEWADACHSQGGTVIIPHLGITNGEQSVLIATGRADAVEMLLHQEYLHQEYYRYLNGGYRLPLAGGTDKMDAQVPVGLYRTYVYIPPDQKFTYESWCKGLRAGRTFLSGGALLWFTVEGQPIGSTVQVKGGGTVEVEARARSIFPIHTLQIVQQGAVVEESVNGEGTHELRLHAKIQVSDDTWLAARCAGPEYTAISHFDSWNRGIMAHTSPIYITCGDTYRLLDPATASYMLTLLDGNLSYIQQLSPQHPADRTAYPHGEDDHLEHLKKPFLEARSAIHRRMHAMGISH